jgi:hypothetical protein
MRLPDDRLTKDQTSTLLAAHAEIAEELAGLPFGSARAQHLRRQLEEVDGTIEHLAHHVQPRRPSRVGW